jgi:hypothetical protein
MLQKMGGWKKMDMVLRYAHFSTDSLAGYTSMTMGTGLNCGVQ